MANIKTFFYITNNVNLFFLKFFSGESNDPYELHISPPANAPKCIEKDGYFSFAISI